MKDERTRKCVSGKQRELGEQIVFQTGAGQGFNQPKKGLSEDACGRIRTEYVSLTFPPNVHPRIEGSFGELLSKQQ